MYQPSPTNPTQRKRFHSISVLILLIAIPIITSCGDFVDHPEESQPTTPPNVPADPPKPQPAPETKPEPSKPPTKPVETPKSPPKEETEEQRNWRMCETERRWAFTAKIIDADLLRLYQNRNFAPVFNNPGVRQSGIEGWYPCKKALQMNGFIPFEVAPDGTTDDGKFY